MKSMSVVAGLLAGCVAAGAAGAQTIDVRHLGTGKGTNVRVTHAGGTQNVFAGQLRHLLSNGTGPAAAFNGEWLTFCSELSQVVTSSTRTYSITAVENLPGAAPMGAQKAAAITDLYTTVSPSVHGDSASNDLAAAFQLAIWEVVADFDPAVGAASLSLTGGTFRATRTNGSALSSGVMNAVNALFAAVGNAGPNARANLTGLTNGVSQDQIIPVPTAGTAVLAGAGLLLAGGWRRR